MADTYTIGTQTEVVKLGPGTQTERVMRVTFVAHPSEGAGTVDVPITDAYVDDVRAAVAARAAQLNAAAGL